MGSCSIRPSRETRRASVAQSTQVLSAVVPITGCGTRHLEDAPVATRLKQPAAHAPQSKQSAPDKRRQLDSSARRFHAQEANSSRVSARAAIPSSSSATPDARAPRPRQGARDKASRATPPPPCAAAPSPTAGVPSVPSTSSVCSNLFTPLKKSGQVASPDTAPRFSIECLRDLLDLLRRLHEQAQADIQGPIHAAGLDGNHGANPAGNPAAPGPLGPSGGDRQAPGINSEDSSGPEP